MYGTLTGRHCCLWCTIPSSDLKLPPLQRGLYPARTLDTLKKDYKRFLSEGGGDLQKAKFFNNVIRDILLGIPLTQVCAQDVPVD